MANIYDVEGIEEFLPEQKKPLSSFLDDYATTANKVAAPYIGMAGKYGFGNDPAKIQGLGSDVRHTTGSALGKFGIQDYFSQFGLQPSNPISNFLGNAGIAGSTVAQEIGDAIRGFRQAGLEGAINQPMEDVKANFRAMGIPYGTSLEDIVNMSVKGSPSAYMANAPEEVKISRFNAPGPFNYGTAQAADLPTNSLERDFPGMSGSDIIEMMNNREFIGNQITPMAKPIDRSNVIGKDLEADAGTQIVDGLKQPYTIRGQIADDIRNLPSDIRNSLGQTKDAFLEDVSGLRNIIGSGIDKFGKGLGSLKDRSLDLGRMAISGIASLLGAGPFGAILSRLPREPLYTETLANSRKANPLGTRGVGPDGVKLDGVSDFGGFTTDDIGRIVQTGDYITPENIMSGYNAGFDLAGSALGRIGKIQDLMARDPKSKFQKDRMKKIDALKTAAVASAQAKRKAYQDKIDRARDAAAREKARVKSITAGYGGGNDNDRPTTGPTAVLAGMGVGGGYASDYGFLKDGGSVGVASMFTRRG